MNFIPSFDLTQQYPSVGEELGTAVLDVLASGQYIGGSGVTGFEQAFARFNGTAECVSCNSGTDALLLALRALNIGAGDEVITTPFTFVATVEVICAIGATPVFVDIEPHTFNLDLQQVEAAITNRTRAIIPVHLFGQPVDMTRLMTIANSYRLQVIEDCAQAVGATWAGKKVGSIGQIGCFSFYPTKNLGACGDGGAVTTQEPEIAAKIRVLRDHGQTQRYVYEEIGINSRLDAIQAAILQVKLRHLDTWNAKRQTIATQYHQLLASLPGIQLPQALPDGQGVWNQYTIRILSSGKSGSPDSKGANHRRDQVRHQLQQRGIGSMVYYPIPLHLQPAYAFLNYKPGDLPIAEQMAQEVLSLPMFPELSLLQQEQVVYALKDSLES